MPGIEICEHLPNLAKQADKYTILRGVEHTLAAHAPGQSYLRSGSKPIPSLEYPNYGSVIAKEYTSPVGIPPYVSLPVSRTNGGVETAGYLGVAYSSFSVGGDPNAKNFSVRALAAPGGLTMERIQSRVSFMQGLDTAFRTADVKSQALDGMDRERYGRTSFGQGCLLARRLVEVGVRCVTIDYGSWDTHKDNFTRLRNTMLPTFDAGVAALLADLSERGMLDNTVVWVTGEFGRTPKINKDAGRDHWARAMSMLLAGGGIRGGQVIGKTNDKGEEPVEGACKPDDVAASFFHAMGIDRSKEYYTPTNRPVMLVRDGQPIDGLFA